MAAVARYLIDKSALARVTKRSVAERVVPLIEAGLVATCGVVDFEMLWSTRTFPEFEQLRVDRFRGYEWLATEDADWLRAIDVQASLWQRGLEPPSQS